MSSHKANENDWAEFLRTQTGKDSLRDAYNKLVQESDRDPNFPNCLVCRRSGNKSGGRGYPVIKPTVSNLPNIPKKTEVYAHQLAFVHKQNYNQPLNKQLEISHICHDTKCINGDHILQETKEMNLSRSDCLKKVNYIFNVNGILRLLNTCPHEPSCLLKRVNVDLASLPALVPTVASTSAATPNLPAQSDESAQSANESVQVVPGARSPKHLVLQLTAPKNEKREEEEEE
jgi:hypothetical protein